MRLPHRTLCPPPLHSGRADSRPASLSLPCGHVHGTRASTAARSGRKSKHTRRQKQCDSHLRSARRALELREVTRGRACACAPSAPCPCALLPACSQPSGGLAHLPGAAGRRREMQCPCAGPKERGQRCLAPKSIPVAYRQAGQPLIGGCHIHAASPATSPITDARQPSLGPILSPPYFWGNLVNSPQCSATGPMCDGARLAGKQLRGRGQPSRTSFLSVHPFGQHTTRI